LIAILMASAEVGRHSVRAKTFPNCLVRDAKLLSGGTQTMSVDHLGHG
jgi:hypothetical protein